MGMGDGMVVQTHPEVKTERRYSTRESIEQVLLRAGMINDAQMQDALRIAGKEDKTVEQVLVEEGYVARRDLLRALSIQLRVPLIDLKKHRVSSDALAFLPEETARKYNVIPLDVIGGLLVLVMEDPMNIQTIDDITALIGMPIEPVMGFIDEIRDAIDRNYAGEHGGSTQFAVTPSHPELEEAELEPEQLLSDGTQAPAIRALNLLILEAVRSRASDIHIEPQKDKLNIRYRIDGVLHNRMLLSLSIHDALIARLKITGGMNIAERKRPQDGQCQVNVDGRNIDIRIACAHTSNGEMAVLRIMTKSASLLKLSDLGFLPGAIEKYQQMLRLHHGMILIGGPTGSGKTTTLYASINRLDRAECNIMTIEDPIEYHLDGINQFQVNPKSGIDFVNSLRAFMRLDPDIILVGEIRDSETAKLAIQAALTGHLVFSSVHANHAVGIIYRLLDLGVSSLLISSALSGVVAQRILRRICPNCRATYEPSIEERTAYQKEMGSLPEQFYRGKGCTLCSGTGYLGQCGVFEIAAMTDETKRLLLGGAAPSEIRARLVKEGMVPLEHDALLKVSEGITTVSEVLRTVFCSS